MFLYEDDLKKAFWDSYNSKGRAKRYMFEAPFRKGNIDLLTLEVYKDIYQLNAFEFKLKDIEAVIEQAKANMSYCNKSWIVVPAKKEKLISNKYLNEIKNYKHIGVITVNENGTYDFLHLPKFKKEFLCTDTTLTMMFRYF